MVTVAVVTVCLSHESRRATRHRVVIPVVIPQLPLAGCDNAVAGGRLVCTPHYLARGLTGVCGKNIPREPLTCNATAETPLQPLIWCFSCKLSQGSSSEECYFHRHRYETHRDSSATAEAPAMAMFGGLSSPSGGDGSGTAAAGLSADGMGPPPTPTPEIWQMFLM